jgi:two-component system sensor histidine kinase PhoQ
MLSLNARLLVAASLVLLAFLGMAGLTLDRAFRESALVAVQDRLQAQVYMLLGAANLAPSQALALPGTIPEARFSTPGSGLYAIITDGDDRLIWRSPSLLGKNFSFPNSPKAGEFQFEPIVTTTDLELFSLSFTVRWEVTPETYRRYTFQVAEDQQTFTKQVEEFRRNLWGWLATSGVVLLAVQGVILHWSLQPLRRIARQVSEIEAGRRTELGGPYPRELQTLTENLNALIRHSQKHVERYRHALGDLAHSLKTPLAVLHGEVENSQSDTELRTTVQQQLEQMNRIVDYQLQRAAASGRIALVAPLAVEPVARKVTDALAKVHADKFLNFLMDVEHGATFYGDEGDLMEILGNLADNACKWARSQVLIRTQTVTTTTANKTVWILEVEDDGPGIPPTQRQMILGRGERAGATIAGHGIGLAVVKNIVEEVYQGRLDIADSSSLSGALIRVRLQF